MKHKSKYSRLEMTDGGSRSDSNANRVVIFFLNKKNYFEGNSVGVNHDKSHRQGNEMHHPELSPQHCAQIKDLLMLW